MNIPPWVTILSALLTPTIAVLAAVIASLQWRTARNKLKLDLFDRRYAVYESVNGLLGSIMSSGSTSQEEELKYLIGTRGTKWLFNASVAEYLEKNIWVEVCNLGALQGVCEGLQGEERTKNIYAQGDIKIRLVDQRKLMDAKFDPFLSLKH